MVYLKNTDLVHIISAPLPPLNFNNANDFKSSPPLGGTLYTFLETPPTNFDSVTHRLQHECELGEAIGRIVQLVLCGGFKSWLEFHLCAGVLWTAPQILFQL